MMRFQDHTGRPRLVCLKPKPYEHGRICVPKLPLGKQENDSIGPSCRSLARRSKLISMTLERRVSRIDSRTFLGKSMHAKTENRTDELDPLRTGHDAGSGSELASLRYLAQQERRSCG